MTAEPHATPRRDAARRGERPLADAEALLSSRGGRSCSASAAAATWWARLRRPRPVAPHGAEPIVGGVTWERRPIDPNPGRGRRTRSRERGGLLRACSRPAAPRACARAGSCSRSRGWPSCSARRRCSWTPRSGPPAIADGLAAAAAELGADLIVFVDVGGDALAHGDEPGLASPLCDAIMLAAAARVSPSRQAHDPGARRHLRRRLRRRAHARRGARAARRGRRRRAASRARAGSRRPIAARLEEAVEAVPTEASAQALALLPRRDRRDVDPPGPPHRASSRPQARSRSTSTSRRAIWSAARLAAAVIDAEDLEAANEILRARGIRTELDYERDALHTVRPSSN